MSTLNDVAELLPDSSGFNFTNTLRTGPTATTLPANNRLPADFSVCILGASRGIGVREMNEIYFSAKFHPRVKTLIPE